MPSRRSILLAVVIAVQAGAVLAQEPVRAPLERVPSPSEGTSQENPLSPAERPPAAATNGPVRFVPLPAGATLQEFENWLRARSGTPVETAPPYGITWTNLEGSADDERAVLEATVQVQVLTGEAWLRIPLRFDEAVLRSTGYAGDGEAQFEPPEANGGYHCWLRGRGRHELKLTFVVPLRKSAAGRRLVLSTPKAAGGSLRLTLPIPPAQLSASAQPPERPNLKVVRAGNGGSSVEVFGLTERLDLTWQAVPGPRQVKPVLQAKTLAVVELAGESVLLNPVTQRIQALRGSMAEIRVRIPEQFRVLQVLVDGVESSGQLKRGSDPEELIVSLSEPTSGPVDLRWVLEVPLQENGELRLEGFEVGDALLQSGEIIIERVEGLTFSQLGGKEVRRTSVLGTEGGVTERGTAYRFLRQPFELVLGVREIEPYFAVRPRMFLKIGTQRADLFAEFEVELFRGALKKFELDWPNLAGEDWTIHPPENPGLVDEWQVDASGRVAAELLQRQTGQFRLSLRASRPITIGAEAFNLRLPVPVASNRSHTVLLAGRDDPVKLWLEPADGTVLREAPERFDEEVSRLLENPDLPDGMRSLQRVGYVIDSESHVVQVQAAVSPPQVLAETSATATVESDHLRVDQVIRFDVDFRRISQLRLLVPEELQRSVRFHLVADPAVELPASWTETESPGQRVARLALPPVPQAGPGAPSGWIGKFDVRAQFRVDRPSDSAPGSESLQVPLVRAADADYGSIHFVFVPGTGIDGAVSGREWERQVAAGGAVGWVTNSAESTVPLILRNLEVQPPPELIIERLVIRSHFDRDGAARSRAYCRLAAAGDPITLSVPAREIELEKVWWNRTRLPLDQWAESERGFREYRITVPVEPSANDGGLLILEYRSAREYPFHWTQPHRIAAPRFAPEALIEETLWEVTLPIGQHLFVAPEGFTPEFQWERDWVFWSRRPHARVSDLESLLGLPLNDEDDEIVLGARGNTYHFSRFGPPGTLELRSMAQSLVLLCGAGLALAASFLLLKVPVLRSPLTLLAAATGLAVAGMWYAAPVQLLLQPAILGLLLALAAVWIDGSLRRRRPAPLLTLSSPSDFAAPAASSSVIRPRGLVGSEDPTSVRPPRGSTPGAPSPSTVSGHGA